MGGASVKLFPPIFKMNFPEIVDIALPADVTSGSLPAAGIAYDSTRFRVTGPLPPETCPPAGIVWA